MLSDRITCASRTPFLGLILTQYLDHKPLREENAKVQSSVSPPSANPFLCGSHATLQHVHQASPDFPPLGFHLQSVFSPRNPQPLSAPRRSHQSRPPAAEAPPPSGSKSPPLPPSPQQLRPTAPLIDRPARRKLRRRRTEARRAPLWSGRGVPGRHRAAAAQKRGGF